VAAVNKWCHSNENSSLDTDLNKCVKVKDAATGKVESHPLRVWHEVSSNLTRHTSFIESTIYTAFQEANKGAAIGKERFRLSVCKCVRNPYCTTKRDGQTGKTEYSDRA
jgi:hypothetical protein